MICRRCHTENRDEAHYCSKCGAHLARRPDAGRRLPAWYVIAAGALGLVAVGFLVSRFVSRPPAGETTRSAQPLGEGPVPAPSQGRTQPGPAGGYVVAAGHDGHELARFPAAVFAGAWVALPASSLVRATAFSYTAAGGGEATPLGWAVWEARAPVVFCRLEMELDPTAPRLSAWRTDAELRWRSLGEDRSSFVIGPVSPGRNGAFLFFPLPEEIRGAGVFVQEEAVVGWTFGPDGERGYLWAGTGDIEREARTQLSELTGPVLGGSREAKLARILAHEGDLPAAAQLSGFVDALAADSTFEDGDLPAGLRLDSVIGRMHALAAGLTQAGGASDVVRVLGDPVLVQTRSAALIEDAVLARAKVRDYASAIFELGRLQNRVFGTQNVPSPELMSFEAQLYRDWLRDILARHGAGGQDAFEKARLAFPDDVEIHFLGVEVAIMEKSWAQAGELLKMRTYPDAAATRAKVLENLIEEGQKDEGVAVLRFDPGTDHIPVECYLNGRVLQKFILDTGAATSSIPSSAVEALGIKIDDTTKVVVVEGIAGRGLTYEVTLDSVELARIRVFNVKAVIADIPGYENTGLLGQNVLNNFQLDIDYKKGILRIRKR